MTKTDPDREAWDAVDLKAFDFNLVAAARIGLSELGGNVPFQSQGATDTFSNTLPAKMTDDVS